MGLIVTLITLLAWLIGFAFILRAWFYATRIPPFNPFSQTIYRVTDWAALPLQQLIKPHGKFDIPSLIVVWLCGFAYLFATFQFQLFNPLGMVIVGALTGLKWWLSILFWGLIIQAILSWVNPAAPIAPLLQALTAPLLNPIRNLLPNTGAIDFSPLVLIIATQVISVLVQTLSRNILFAQL